MGLTSRATGAAAESPMTIKKRRESDLVVALAGNPNVGKSTIFNGLTGLNQHTGNWTGKTVTNACGSFSSEKQGYLLVDIPGTYSLMAHSAEEEVARDFVCFGGADAAVVVCDAGCLERSLNLALQVMEICPRTLVCVNLMDEAHRNGITVDTQLLSQRLGVPVVGTIGHSKRSLKALTAALDELCADNAEPSPCKINCAPELERALCTAQPVVAQALGGRLNARWTTLRLIEGDRSLEKSLCRYLGWDIVRDEAVAQAVENARTLLAEEGITADKLRDMIVSGLMLRAEELCAGAVTADPTRRRAERRADRLLTGKMLGYPVMILLLMCVFWLTLVGANYPSEWLSVGLFRLGDRLSELLCALGAPPWLEGVICDGAYRVTAWVVSVMLPPMAIFFPLFTLLEDSGYLPRVAYNLDKPFSRCSACGKQALCMCIG